MKLSLGARQLLTFLQTKSTRNGYCYWKQGTIASAFGKDIRTIRRWIAELADNEHQTPKILSIRHGHFNYYITDEMQVKMSYLAKLPASVEKSVEIERKTKDAVLSDRTFLSHRGASPLLTENLGLEIQDQESSEKVERPTIPVLFQNPKTPRKPPDSERAPARAVGASP